MLWSHSRPVASARFERSPQTPEPVLLASTPARVLCKTSVIGFFYIPGWGTRRKLRLGQQSDWPGVLSAAIEAVFLEVRKVWSLRRGSESTPRALPW